MPLTFRSALFNVTDQLPGGWREDIGAVAAEAHFRAFPRTPILSREAPDVTHIIRGRVYADQVQQRVPWLYKLYRNDFTALATKAWGEAIDAAFDDRYGVVLNVQIGTRMRFECHVDSNPVTGLLFFTDHPAGGVSSWSGETPRRSASKRWNGTAPSSRHGQGIWSSSTGRPTRITREHWCPSRTCGSPRS